MSLGVLSSISGAERGISPLFSLRLSRGWAEDGLHLLYIFAWRQDRQRGCFFPVGHPGRVTRSPSKSGNCLTAAFISNTWAQ